MKGKVRLSPVVAPLATTAADAGPGEIESTKKMLEWVLRDGLFMKDGDTVGGADGKGALRLRLLETPPTGDGPVLRLEDAAA